MKEIFQQNYRGNSITPEVLIGKTITFAADGGIRCSDGSKYVFEHIQDCCEGVDLLDSDAFNSLTGNTITGVTAEQSNDLPDDVRDRYTSLESYTLTTVKFEVEGGPPVIVRWLGMSNGYYDERIGFFSR